MSKIKHNYKCSLCGKPATVSLEDSWHKYFISDDGEFSEQGEWNGGHNEFYCDKCAEENGYL